MRCAVYTRKSCEEGLDQNFNSLDAQRLSGEQYIATQLHDGWSLVPTRYDDGGFSGGTLERPGLKQLMSDIEAGLIDCIVVYKIDRLSRSLADFTKLLEKLNQYNVAFVSTTQPFNTTGSAGRLTLHVLLSLSQYERELTGERIRDKVAASKKLGIWMGGRPPLGYDISARKLVVNAKEAELVRHIYQRFLVLKSTTAVMQELNNSGKRTKHWVSAAGITFGGKLFTKNNTRSLLQANVYRGKVYHKGDVYAGQHVAIVDNDLWLAVQALFTSPQNKAVRTQQTPLLQNVLRCHSCNAAMTYTYTKKAGRKYSYYVCNQHLRTKTCKSPYKNVPAADVEQFVVTQLLALLNQPEITAQAEMQLTAKGITSYQAIQKLQNIATLWHTLFPPEQQHLCQCVVTQVWVKPGGVEIQFQDNAVTALMQYGKSI